MGWGKNPQFAYPLALEHSEWLLTGKVNDVSGTTISSEFSFLFRMFLQAVQGVLEAKQK